MAAFDPYHKWLAIPKELRPPNLFQLLGISPDETDPEVIEEAAIRQTSHVRAYRLGPHAEECTRILNEIAKARSTLLNPAKRKAYQQQLAERSATKLVSRPRLDQDRVRRRPDKKPLLIGLGVGGGVLVVGIAVVLVVFGPSGHPNTKDARPVVPNVAAVPDAKETSGAGKKPDLKVSDPKDEIVAPANKPQPPDAQENVPPRPGEKQPNPLPDPGSWKLFAAPEFGFRVAFPHDPEHIKRQASNTFRTMHRFEVKDSDERYTVVTFDPPRATLPSHLFQSFKAIRDDFPMGVIDPEKPLKLGSYRGWEFTIRFIDATIVERDYHGFGRDYTLRVSSGRFPTIAADAQKFFDSFKPDGWDRAAQAAVPPVKEPPARQQPPHLLQGGAGEIMSLTFSNDGITLVAVSQNGEFLSWEPATAKRTRSDSLPGQPVRFLAVAQAPDGDTAVSTLAGPFWLLDAATLRPKTVFLSRLGPQIASAVAFSPDGRHVAAGHADNVARLWPASGEKPQWEWKGNNRVNALVFTPDGKTLAGGTLNNTVYLWNADTGMEIAVLKGRPGEVRLPGAVWALACSPDGKRLAAGGNDRSVRLWSLETRTEYAVLKHTDTVRSLAFAPDGKLLATGDDSGNVALWDAERGSRRAFMPAKDHTNSVRTLQFSPQTTLLAAGAGNDVAVWDLAKIRWDDSDLGE